MKNFLILIFACSTAFGAFTNGYLSQIPDDFGDNTVLRTYRRCMWEQSKFLPRRLVLLSLCSNLFCENNSLSPRSRNMFVVEKVSRPNDCLDMLTDQCQQGDEEELMYKPYPDCCPVYCNLKRRLARLKAMMIRNRRIAPHTVMTELQNNNG